MGSLPLTCTRPDVNNLLVCRGSRSSQRDSEKAIRALIIGAPGCGKGTISSWIARDFHWQHVSSGDLLRALIQKGTPLGKQAKEYIGRGDLLPDELITEVIIEELKNLDTSAWLLDGFPRTLPQAEALQKEAPVNIVLQLDVPFQVIIDRVKGRWVHPGSGRIYHNEFNPPKVPGIDDLTGEKLTQREDDKLQSVRNRLQVFSEQTRPVLEYYQRLGILQEFTGSSSTEMYPHIERFIRNTFQ